jgi:hypothetical protein
MGRGQNGLGNPMAPQDRIGLAPQVDQENAYFASIVAVYRTRAVENRHSVPEGQTTARADLSLPTRWDLEAQSGRDQTTLHRVDADRR